MLPLLFFKRISDVWDEETADAATLFGDADPVEFPEVHRFNVPAGCHWRDVRETPANVGAALSHAMREIERANLRCTGPHILRHTFCSHLAMRGAVPGAIQKLAAITTSGRRNATCI